MPIYKDESKLAPTFHALTPLTVSVPTAISDLNPDAISISAGEGVIYANGYVSVYTLQGQKVYEGNAAEITVAPGLYAVKAAGKTVKVLVK